MKKKILLVRLPKVDGIEQDFYGVGYNEGNSFVFMILTPDFINKFPLRAFPFPEYNGYDSSSYYEVIGEIVNLPKFGEK